MCITCVNLVPLGLSEKMYSKEYLRCSFEYIIQKPHKQALSLRLGLGCWGLGAGVGVRVRFLQLVAFGVESARRWVGEAVE